ncbi:MAG: TonB-dependent receptor, partial [Acidobacteria bacterium]|nr:TonB-dependent receptor [Acidobacteriota bacterium]
MNVPIVGRHEVFTIILFSGLFLAVEPTGSAQTAQVTGRITDTLGAVIQGSRLTLTKVDTGISKHAVSNEAGVYTIPFLPPGQYRITVQMAGFKPHRLESLALSVDQVARLDFELKAEALSEEMTIESTAPLLERETSSVGQVIENKTIVTLPLNGRNYSQLAVLMPGAIPDAVSASVADGFNLNGNRTLQNLFLVDGIDNNNSLIGIQTGSTQALRPSIDAIQEFRVESANYSAEYGRAAGGVISVMTKSGTNSFHGSAFEFLRNDKLDANDFFANRAGLERAPLRFNQFGGTLGGPILHNRLFFFASYQGTRNHRSETATGTVPTPEMPRGDFSRAFDNQGRLIVIYDPLNVVGGVRQPFPNNIIPESRLDAVGRRLAGLYPAPNQPGVVDNFVANVGFTDDADQLDLRLDQSLGASDNLFIRYSRADGDASGGSIFDPPGNGGAPFLGVSDAYSIAGGETHVFSASVANEFRAGLIKSQSDQRNPATKSFYEEFGIKGVPPSRRSTGLPAIRMAGNFTDLGDDNLLPDKRQTRVFHIHDNLSWVRGNHSTKFGAELRFRKRFTDSPVGSRGVFTFDGRFTRLAQGQGGSALADLLLGQTSMARLGTGARGDLRDHYYGFYGSDTWKLTPKLTLNLGLRFELQTPAWEVGNRMAIFDLDRSLPSFGTLVLASDGSIRSRTFSNLDKNNLAPRLGFAWQVNSRTVLRGAFGIFYGVRGFEGGNSLGTYNPPYSVDRTVNSPAGAVGSRLVLADGFPEGFNDPKNLQNPTVYAQPADFPWPEVYQWNLGIQREVIGDLLFSLTYVGSGTVHLNGYTDANQPLPGRPNPPRPISGFGPVYFQSPFAHATYHSLQAKVERRFSRGFSSLSSYTWSHAIDNSVAVEDIGGLGGGSQYAQDSNNTRAEKASSSFDIRQRFVTSLIYELPIGRRGSALGNSGLGRALLGGWRLGGIFVVQGGQPMTPFVNPNPAQIPNPTFTNPAPFRPDRLR